MLLLFSTQFFTDIHFFMLCKQWQARSREGKGLYQVCIFSVPWFNCREKLDLRMRLADKQYCQKKEHLRKRLARYIDKTCRYRRCRNYLLFFLTNNKWYRLIDGNLFMSHIKTLANWIKMSTCDFGWTHGPTTPNSFLGIFKKEWSE